MPSFHYLVIGGYEKMCMEHASRLEFDIITRSLGYMYSQIAFAYCSIVSTKPEGAPRKQIQELTLIPGD